MTEEMEEVTGGNVSPAHRIKIRMSEERVGSSLGDTLSQSLTEDLGVKDQVKCVSSERLTGSVVEEEKENVKSSHDCFVRTEEPEKSQSVNPPRRFKAAVDHVCKTLKGFTAKIKTLCSCRPGPMSCDQRWMVSIEGQVVCEGASVVLGLAVVFTSYYNFNLQYQDHAACTLEFFQRSCVGINQERGTKARQGKVTTKKSGKMVQKKVTSLNPHVCTLLQKLMDFEWDFL